MAIEQVFIFEADNEDIVHYNQMPLLNLAISFNYNDDDETAYGFTGYVSGFLKIYDERLGYMIKNFTTQITRNSNYLVANCSTSDMTFNDSGKFYYEMGFVQSGGYSIVLRYGVFEVI